MQIFSKGTLYIGKDDESFTLVSIHLGKYLVEWEHKPKSNESRPVAEESD